MANYSKINNFTAKDSLASGNASKRIRGIEFDQELTAIATAIATKPDTPGVTSVQGTGTASGLTLSGTVTTSGSLTLSGNVNSLAAGTYNVNITGSAGSATTATSAVTAGSAGTAGNAATVDDPFPTVAKAIIDARASDGTSASMVFTGLAAWDTIDLVFVDLGAPNTSNYTLMISYDNGATFPNFGYQSRVSDTTASNASAVNFVLTRGATGNMNGICTLSRMGDLNVIMSSTVLIGPGVGGRTCNAAGRSGVGFGANAIRLLADQPFTTGAVYIYGRVKK